jgi:hypothetical protein
MEESDYLCAFNLILMTVAIAVRLQSTLLN